MPLLFSRLCDLLSALEDLSRRDPPLLPARFRQRTNDIIQSWFTSHRVSINSPHVDAVALLSALLPIKRTDRVYNIQPPRLSRCLRRWLCLGKTRWPLLDKWQEPGRGDLGDCVEMVLKQAENPTPHQRHRVTLEEVDTALATVAARCRFSAPKVRARGLEEDAEVINALEKIYQRLQSRDAKWFTRLILKDFSYLDLPETLIYTCIDSRLRVAMQMYHDFESAICELRNLPASQMADMTGGGFTQQFANDAHLLPPRIGVKLGPPKWVKAKGGVKHAISVIDGRTMSVERKHDGEYCQIHVDLSKGEDCIQIFSKSGKDSTEDRRGVHAAIKDGLRIGSNGCRFSEKCILEGELLVYSDQTKEILDFHKIRKHVSRSGSYLGTVLDSPPHHRENLMIMFYDVMLIDEDLILHQAYAARRSRLEKLVKHVPGRSKCVWQTRVRFSKPEGPKRLMKALALAFARRWEGLVLKPYDDAYFDLNRVANGKFSSRCIKLKKDCIKGLGDTADFAVIGGGYDAVQAAKFPGMKLQWTQFFIACLRNKQDVLHHRARPSLLVFDVVGDCIKKEDLKRLNELGYLRAVKPDSDEASNIFHLDYAVGLSRPKDIYRIPFVFDIAGSGFDQAPNRDIFTLRFPRVMRIHWDRSWQQAVSLDELQEMAAVARKAPSERSLPEEIADWVEKLNDVERRPKGQLNSWDYSDDEEEDCDIVSREASSSISPGASRRPRVATAPPLIRMDTQEMDYGERRLSTGEVVEHSSSKHLMAGITSDGSLQTPPNSSPLARNQDEERIQQAFPSSDNRVQNYRKKRAAHIADLEEGAGPPKKLRLDLDEQIKELSRGSPKQTRALHKRPLREIMNPTHLLSPGRATAKPQQIETQSKTTFDLVRKLPVGVEEHIYQRASKKRKIDTSPSSARETTASESQGTTTTQSSAPEIMSPRSQLSQPSEAQTNKPQSLPTPPSTADQPVPISLPDLEESKIVLSPCLIKDREPIEPLKQLLTNLSVSPSSFHQALYSPRSNNILHRTAKPTTQIVLLVDSLDAEATTDAMFRLVKNVPIWDPISFAVWDWRILQVIDEGNIPVEDEGVRSMYERRFYANMGWNAEWEGRGAVVVKWRDGTEIKVEKEYIERMREG